MNPKEPVLLVVLITTADFRWHVAGISMQGDSIPLLQSEPGNLDAYLGGTDDEQVSFLRHRLSGVLQRGCDRLWGKQKKPCQIVFVADGNFRQASADLTRRVAEHFVQWMTNPPVIFFTSPGGFATSAVRALNAVAGEMDAPSRHALDTGLRELLPAIDRPQLWNADEDHPSSG